MKINKYEKQTKGKYRLYLDNGEIIDTYDDVILKNNLLTKKEVTLKTYNQIQKDNLIYENYTACLKYISIRIRSTQEIKDYLKRKNIPQEPANIIIQKLQQENNLNDKNFTKCFINDKLKFTNWGEYKIKLELKKHNIDSNIIEQYLSKITSEQYYDKLNKLIEKKIKANHKLDNKKLKNKLYRHFINLGYESSMIINILNQKL